MLVCTWDALSDAIPRLQAEERLAAYTVAAVAFPQVEQQARDSILNGWRNALDGVRSLVQPHASTNSPRLDRRLDAPLKDVIAKIKGAFGAQIRD